MEGSTGFEPSSSFSTQQSSPPSTPCPGSPSWTLSNSDKAVLEPETAKQKTISPAPMSTPTGLRSLSPASQHHNMMRFEAGRPPNLSTSSTWDVPSVESTCFSSTVQDSDPRTRKRSVIQRAFDKSWVQPTIGLTTLLITLIALFVYSHRSFVIAKWTEENDMLQACAQLVQVRLYIAALTQSTLIASPAEPSECDLPAV